MLIYFVTGRLPWQGLQKSFSSRQSTEILLRKKKEDLFLFCCLHGVPQELASVIDYARGLGFTDTPDYDFVRQIYENVFQAHGYVKDNVFDWMATPSTAVSTVPYDIQPRMLCDTGLYGHYLMSRYVNFVEKWR